MTDRRKKILVHRDLQLALIAQSLGITTVALAAFALGIVLIARALRSAPEGYADEALPLILATLLAFAVMVGLGLLLGLRTTHRLAGPLFRAQRLLDRWGEGDLRDTLDLRKGDLLQDFAERFDAARAGQRKLVQDMRAAAEALRAAVEEAREALPSGSPAAERLARAAEGLAAAVDRFRTGEPAERDP